MSYTREVAIQIDLAEFQENAEQKLRIKISGDGAKMTRMTSFVIMSFSLLDNDDVMSSKGSHTIGVVKGVESYELLRDSFKDVFNTINQIVKDGKISIKDHNIPVELLLGGDYKFLLLLLGMKSATSDHSCIWCTIHKNNRFDMSKSQEYYSHPPMSRTLEEIKKCALKQNLSCVHPPLVDIPLQNIVLDELHVMLRVTDILTRNLVTAAISWDKKENYDRRPCERTNLHVEALLSAINSCGVCFKIWEKKDADGKGSGTYDFTSLMGSDKKLLLSNLPEKLDGVVDEGTSATVIKIWKDFSEIYQMLNEQNPSDEYITSYFEKAKAWILLFTSLGGICEGYGKANVTPYMHSMVYHVPRFMKTHTGVKRFTGQGTEENNDDCRRIHLRKSNKWDAAGDVLYVMKRVEAISEHERTPRAYTKRSAQYWENDLLERREKHKRLGKTQRIGNPSQAAVQHNIEQLSPAELRKQLKTLGVSTRARNLKRLQQMYQDALNQVTNSSD
ncbi:uncharacterized protein LOC114541217 [Dendronephthya gigantea]|uniref:uncharacterized protein LOC114541217 n=1 Tax=Dendronephthya gigantea TaxID=151771 RepID=UPI00106BE4F4|nr:uncharacterized protein LOC114541217 [Dendronephthya gigantea]